jgi:tetratricopeptide (TPR) repeat protein
MMMNPTMPRPLYFVPSVYSSRAQAYLPAFTPLSTAPFTLMQAENLKNVGNELRRAKRYLESEKAYQQALQLKPDYTDAWYNLAQLHGLQHDYTKAIPALQQLLRFTPEDHEARVLLGQYLELAGFPREAKTQYIDVVNRKPDFDPARRRLQYMMFLDQYQFDSQMGNALWKSQEVGITYQAKELLKHFFETEDPNPELALLSQKIKFVFESTSMLSDTASVAEYDAKQNVIRFQPQLLFTTPNVLAAYAIHEMVHARDGDDQTSITEEQDAYRKLARFWISRHSAENDPNLDKALSLYQQGAGSLDAEVRRVYRVQMPDITETSPGHGQPEQGKNSLLKGVKLPVSQLSSTRIALNA